MAAASSPSSSPRLPSPPPIAEDQIGPTSPGISLYEDQGKLAGANNVDTGASRRIRPGTKAEHMHEGPPLVELQDIESAFPLTEHLKALHYHHTHPPESNTVVPITADLARQLAAPPPGTSKDIWLYELARFLIQKTNAIIVHLFADSPPCSPQTCPEMRASEWQYLCAVHDPPKSCAAIDYCCHTLDWAATALTSSKMFPSRLGLGSGSAGGSDKVLSQQMKEITNIFRRVYRIYAHAWFQHRDMFWRVEGKTGLYVFFKTVCDEYGLIQPENYTISPEAEGLELEDVDQEKEQEKTQVPSIMRRGSEDATAAMQPAGNTVEATGNTTKRHTPGHGHMRTQSTPIDKIIQEENEEDDNTAATRSNLHRSSTILLGSDKSMEAEAESEQNKMKQQDAESEHDLSKRDTLKPDMLSKPEEESQSMQEDAEDADAGDVTAIFDGNDTAVESKAESESGKDSKEEVKIEPISKSATEESEVQVKVEAIDPSESEAADPDEAGKTVAD